jgi:DNA-binding response OmpR family regulator
MLPTRAYNDLSLAAAARLRPDEPPVILVAADRSELERFPGSSVIRLCAHTTADVLTALERSRPRVVALDWDCPEIAAANVIEATRRFPNTGVLVAMSTPEHAPTAIRSGCHAVLLKPFAPNLAAARIGRLCREMPTSPAGRRVAAALHTCGTNRLWSDERCPSCNEAGVTSFEFSSYRRMWYACLACNHVWLGHRRE